MAVERPSCPGCGRESSRAARHEAKVRAHEVSKHLCPGCLMEIVRGLPQLKERIRTLEYQIRELRRR